MSRERFLGLSHRLRSLLANEPQKVMVLATARWLWPVPANDLLAARYEIAAALSALGTERQLVDREMARLFPIGKPAGVSNDLIADWACAVSDALHALASEEFSLGCSDQHVDMLARPLRAIS